MRHLRHLRPGAPQRDFLFGEYQEGDPSSSRTFVWGKHRIRLAAERSRRLGCSPNPLLRAKILADSMRITIKRDKGGWAA